MGTRILAAGGSTPARVLVVDKEGNADYTKIQDALNAANNQTPSANAPWLVVVAPGNYQESLTLYDYVHLAGLSPENAAAITPTSGAAITNAAIMTLTNIKLAGDGSTAPFDAASINGTMKLVHVTIEDDNPEIPGITVNNANAILELLNCIMQAGGPAIQLTAGTVKAYHSNFKHYHTSATAATEGAVEINGGTIHLEHCIIENTAPTGPAIDFKAAPTQAKITHCILRMASGYSATIDADVTVSPIIANTIGNGSLHANVSSPISYTWDPNI